MNEIEVIAINLNTGEILKKVMLYDEWLIFHKTKRKKGFNYIPYKIGFSQFN
ncbi:hypothetical protein UFOVP638_29 [uncultured Caudovirales phage]|uniref:Uncharacterized protein n=1 Tax=uncultured Caudovirales phage TaxID=2100421 RepID=A0A6J5N2K6_9CAUD|nr:hypothetical protein UFOVP638_29 [uncultured Caudovirales phage]